VADTMSGLLVCAATYSGAAIVARPLPRAEVVLASQSLANRPPSGSAMLRRYLLPVGGRRGDREPGGGRNHGPFGSKNAYLT
jgi:hypothetical protein